MTNPPAVDRDIRTRAAYSEGAGIHRIVPAGVAVPRSPEEVRELVRWAAESGATLVPRGAGSAMTGNAVGPGIVVDMSQGFHRLAVDPGGRVALTGTSVTWAALTAAAREHGLRLPPDPSSGAFATAGGMVATNAAGPRSVRYGSVRPWVAGLEIVGADGEARWVRRGAGSGAVNSIPLAPSRSAAFLKTRKTHTPDACDSRRSRPVRRGGGHRDRHGGRVAPDPFLPTGRRPRLRPDSCRRQSPSR
jgi:FAD/FMN-containing dehydrogenase